MLIGNQELIHDINSELILTHIINDSPISRATLARKLSLTKATISSIVQELINKDLSIEFGNDNTSRGRKPKIFSGYAGYPGKLGHTIIEIDGFPFKPHLFMIYLYYLIYSLT